jgi:hypothetical protein
MAFTKVEDWLETAASNTELNGIPLGENIMTPADVNNAFREMMSQFAKHFGGDTLASAATADLNSVPGQYVNITGTTTITSLGTAPAGTVKVLLFDAALTLTYGGSAIILPENTSMTTGVGDIAEFLSLGSGIWRMTNYLPRLRRGTFTAGVGLAVPGGTNINSQSCTYYKDGALCHINIVMNLGTSTGSGATTITNLPFTSYATEQMIENVVSEGWDLDGQSAYGLYGIIASGGTGIALKVVKHGSASTAALWTPNTIIRISGSYLTAN